LSQRISLDLWYINLNYIQYAQVTVHGILKTLFFYMKTQIAVTIKEKYNSKKNVVL